MEEEVLEDWVCVKICVAICKVCGETMSLWKNKRTGQYSVVCDWCPNEYIPEVVED